MAALATLTLGDSERVRTHPAPATAASTLSDDGLGRATRLVLSVLGEVTP